MAMSSSRPASMRVVHQAPPPVATRLTRSPSRTPVRRNSATAPLARCAWCGVRWMSSNTTTNERPVRDLRREVGGDPRPGRACVADAVAGTSTASKLAIFCGLSSSKIWKSAGGEAGRGHALLVRDHHVDGDLLDLGREARSGGVRAAARRKGTATGPARPVRRAGAGRGRMRGRALESSSLIGFVAGGGGVRTVGAAARRPRSRLDCTPDGPVSRPGPGPARPRPSPDRSGSSARGSRCSRRW